MFLRTSFCAVMVFVMVTGAFALSTDDELWIPAAARGAGNEGSFWITDLYVMNLGEEQTTVEITWLERDTDNSEAEPVEYDIDGGATLILEDVIAQVFGAQESSGAIRIEVKEDEDGEGDKDIGEKGEDDETMLMATARIYNLDDGATFGQGFEGITSAAAISATHQTTTHVIGITDNAAFRTNWYGLNISTDAEDEPVAGQVMVELLDTTGTVLATNTYNISALAPILMPVSGLGAGDVDSGMLRFTMLAGSGIFGASKIDAASNDPTTLEAHWDCEEDEEEVFTDEFFIEDCTWSTTGSNPFFILEPGFILQLEGEEDGKEITATVTVLDETFDVDGVTTRVVEERESEEGELIEVSRNYFAQCLETASVFYFGEHVDDYEDGEIVGHEGEWLAGMDGAKAGVIMPGTILIGARYQQETAPGVAMDRGEIEEMGITIETEAGTFTDCIKIVDSSPFDPGEEDEKIFCPGVGNVVDEDLELVEFTDPSTP